MAVVLIVAAAYLSVTTPWLSVEEGVDRFRLSDSLIYFLIAERSPSLPDRALGSAYTYRWPVHWTVGAVSDLTGLPLSLAYRLSALAVLAAVVGVVWSLSTKYGGKASAVVATGLVLVNPFDARLYVIGPAMFADLVCALGSLIAVSGLLKPRPAFVVIGSVVVATSRQTGVLLLPLIGLWCLVGPGWRGTRSVLRYGVAAGAVLLSVAGAAAQLRVAAGFSKPSGPDLLRDNVVVDFLDLPENGLDLLRHVALSVDHIWILIVAFLVLGSTRGREEVRQAWWVFSAGLVLALQPLMVSPRFPGLLYNEPRIAAIGAPLLAVALAMMWRRNTLTLGQWGAMIAALALISVTRGIGWPSVPAPLALTANAAGAAVLIGVMRRTRSENAVP